jgi:hypothetical protein
MPTSGQQPATGPAPTPPASARLEQADDRRWQIAVTDDAKRRESGTAGNYDAERQQQPEVVVVQ